MGGSEEAKARRLERGVDNTGSGRYKMTYTCDRRRGVGIPDAPGGQVGEVGDGDTRDEGRTRSERLVIQSRNTELQDALTGRGTASCATEDARCPAHLAPPLKPVAAWGRERLPTATGPRSQRHGTEQSLRFPEPEQRSAPADPQAHSPRGGTKHKSSKVIGRAAHKWRVLWLSVNRGKVPAKLAAARGVCIYLYDKLFERKAVYDTKTRITIGATAHLMMCVDGNTLGSLLDTATQTHEETRSEP